MALANEPRVRGLEDLRWQSLTKPEKLVVAALLDRAQHVPPVAHLDNVAFELRLCAQPGVSTPLVLTSWQNRMVAEALAREGDELEQNSDRYKDTPAIARSAHYAAGFIRSLIDRLVKGEPADTNLGIDLVVQLLVLESPPANNPHLSSNLVDAAANRLRALGLDDCLQPVLEACAAKAVQFHAAHPAVVSTPLDEDVAFEFEIIDVTEQQLHLAHHTFDAAIRVLTESQVSWCDFMLQLSAGQIANCESAPEYPGVAQKAASTAYTLAATTRQHLQQMMGVPWEAVRPGLRAILDGYPALKKRQALKDYVRQEVGRYFRVKGAAANG